MSYSYCHFSNIYYNVYYFCHYFSNIYYNVYYFCHYFSNVYYNVYYFYHYFSNVYYNIYYFVIILVIYIIMCITYFNAIYIVIKKLKISISF